MATDDTFWVIFDVSQHRDYYKDVHNLLASPADATMRYNYDEQLLTSSARELLESPTRPILFVYAQRNTAYIRKNGKSEPIDPDAEYVFVPTRLGKMLKVSKLGSRYHFDFTLDSYPLLVPSFNQIMQPLRDQSAVPLDKFVCTSDLDNARRSLFPGDEQAAWQAITGTLGSAPMQFARDAFWRLTGPFCTDGKVQRPTLKDGSARYHSPEYKSYTLGLITDVGHTAVTEGLDFSIAAASSDKAIVVQGVGQFPARHYSQDDIVYNTAAPPPFFTHKLVELQCSTEPKGSWPNGPDLRLQYVVARNPVAFAISCLAVLVGAFLIAYGLVAKPLNHAPWAPFGDIIVAILGAALIAVGLWWITGKFDFRSPV